MLLFSAVIYSQRPNLQGVGNRLQQFGRNNGLGNTGSNDSLRHRNNLEDSITISFRYLDSTRNYRLDSSIIDFTNHFPISATSVYLGNVGNATRSILFEPSFTTGWDPGFHAFDSYKWSAEKVRFFNTTRPYSELNYMLGSRVEQIIELLHTQNIKPNWNFLLQYRLVNSPGFFKNQKTNHNNYLLSSWYQSNSRRYNNYFFFLANKLQSGESGGIRTDQDYLNDPVYKDRFNISTEIGGDPQFGRDFFSTTITTGNKYSESTVLMRQQFDFGKKDSLVTDSTVVPLFYPRLRFEHTLKFEGYKYRFQDFPNIGNIFYVPDSIYYQLHYAYTLKKDTINFLERWKNISNDFSIIQFPDSKNLQQFIKLGAELENIRQLFDGGKNSFYNLVGHAEYRNKSRNRLWDIEASGKLYFTGLNSGDYEAFLSLQRFTGKKQGYILLGFHNSNRSPSFIFDSRSSFYFMPAPINFKKENNTELFGSYFLPSLAFKMTAHYYLMNNYTYISSYHLLQQQGSLFNVLRLEFEKSIRLGRHWIWHAELYLHQIIGTAPVNLPTLYTRNMIGYEGNLGFPNLAIAMGFEVRYHSPYKADGYSPVLGHFYLQDSLTIRDKLPDIAAYLHFRIKSFKAFVRAENLNTARKLDTFGFTNNNLVAPGYPTPGLVLRLGIYWSFVN